MTLPIEPPPVGEIRYFDRIEPALTAGQYTFEITQELPSEMNLNKSNFNRQIDFNIRGPRWKIDPANVHMRSPPKNEQGVLCDMSFPRIVLQRKTTPWERSLEGSDNDEDPWMCLLFILTAFGGPWLLCLWRWRFSGWVPLGPRWVRWRRWLGSLEGAQRLSWP